MKQTLPEAEKDTQRASGPRGVASEVTLLAPEQPAAVELDAPDAPPDGDRYTSVRVLGAGGMGEVRLCADRTIGRDVALKSMQPDLARNTEFRTRFVREARVQGQLEHPTVVPVYDLGSAPGGVPFFTMRRVSGPTLDRVIEAIAEDAPGARQEFTLRRRLAVFQQICLGVAYSHARGVVHRDLKPSNVMVGHWGETYVLDWGLAKIRGEKGAPSSAAGKTLEGQLMGTPGYMAPEQAVAAQSVDERADVYSLGAILFELLTLKPLHQGSSTQELLRSTQVGADARASERAPELEIPPELDAVCVKATELDLRQRYRSARAIYDAVELFLEGRRDVEVRRQLAARHVRAASRALDRGTEEGRVVAMREAGRALALDPESKEALALVLQLAFGEQGAVPEEVQRTVRSDDQAEQVLASKMGIVAYGVLALVAGVAGMFGDDTQSLAVTFGALLFAVGLCARAVRWPEVAEAPNIIGVSACAAVAIAATGSVSGPLMLVPQLAVANAIALNLRNLGRARWAHLALSCAAVAVPSVLEWTGVIPNRDLFVDGTIQIRTLGMNGSEIALSVLHLVATMTAIGAAAVVLWRLDDNLAALQVKLSRQLWHLRQLVPQAVLTPKPQASVATTQQV